MCLGSGTSAIPRPKLVFFVFLCRMSESSAIKRIMDEPANTPVIRKLLLTTVAMIVVPIAVFFVVRHVAEARLSVQPGGANLCGGVAAAVVVNIIMVFYVFLAWNERLDDPAATVPDKKSL